MDLKDSAALGRAIEGLPPAARVRALAACRVGILMTYAQLEGEGLEAGPVLDGFSRPPLRVYRVTSVVPRVRLVGIARPLPADRNLADVLSDPGYDPHREVLIEGLPAGVGGALPSGDAGEAEVVEETPERLVIAVRAPARGFVVVADAYAPGWRAILDGRVVPILRADGLFRAVAVTAGEHALEMVYRPVEVPAGFAASLAGLLVAAAWGMTAAVKKL
jgi:hypothetical protein